MVPPRLWTKGKIAKKLDRVAQAMLGAYTKMVLPSRGRAVPTRFLEGTPHHARQGPAHFEILPTFFIISMQ